uniref:hypothetical protein n=1 Tax=Algoriphagus sp. PAP.12 TaxID=2996678 RepID=UPI00227C1AC1
MDQQYSIFRKLFSALFGFLLIFFLGVGNFAFAQNQNVKPFTQRVGTPAPPNNIFRIKGDYTMIGNTNLTLDSYSDNSNNSNNEMIYVDIDGDGNTLNSSSSTLVLSQENGADPNCSEILYAGLYWSGRSDYSTDYIFDVGGVDDTNSSLEHNDAIGNGTSYSMSISREGTSSNGYPVYTFSGSGDTYRFYFTNSSNGGSGYLYYTINGGSPIYPSGQNRETNTPGNDQTRVTFNPVVFVDGNRTISIDRLTRDEDADATLSDFQDGSNYARVNVTGAGTTFDKRQVKLKGPGDANYTTVNASNSNILYPGSDQAYMFVGYTDITQFVKDRGIGEYTVADIALLEGNGGSTGYFGQWGIVVIYENSKMPWRDITLFDGYSFVQSPGNGALAEGILPITGFNAVQNGPVNVKLGVMAGEGDRGISGDFLQIEQGVNTNNWQSLSHPLNTTGNFFNSSIYTPVLNGSNTLVENPRSPNILNNTGIDIAMWNIDNSGNSIIANSQTSTRFKYGTTQDLYAIYFVAFAVDAYIPDVTGLQILNSIDGNSPGPTPTVLPGGVLEYQVEIRNQGTEAVNDVQIVIPLPYTASFEDATDLINFSPTGAVDPYFDPLLGATGSIVWDLGDIPLPSDPDEVLAVLTYSIKVTEDCFILSNPNCEPYVSTNGTISGTGAVSQSEFEGLPFIQGFLDGACEGEPIQEALIVPINVTPEWIAANCEEEDLFKDFFFCNIDPQGSIPVSNIRGSFPPGTRFFDGPDAQTATEFTDNNPFPAQDGTYYAIPANSSDCVYEFDIVVTIVNTTPDLPSGDIIYCVGAIAPNLNTLVLPSNAGAPDEYTVYFYTSETGGTASLGIPINTTTAGTFTYWAAEGPSTSCIGERVAVVVEIEALPTFTVTNPSAVCSPETVDITGSVSNSPVDAVFTYWTDATATNDELTELEAGAISASGTYYIKATSPAGCYVIEPVVVTINPLPTF